MGQNICGLNTSKAMLAYLEGSTNTARCEEVPILLKTLFLLLTVIIYIVHMLYAPCSSVDWGQSKDSCGGTGRSTTWPVHLGTAQCVRKTSSFVGRQEHLVQINIATHAC